MSGSKKTILIFLVLIILGAVTFFVFYKKPLMLTKKIEEESFSAAEISPSGPVLKEGEGLGEEQEGEIVPELKLRPPTVEELEPSLAESVIPQFQTGPKSLVPEIISAFFSQIKSTEPELAETKPVVTTPAGGEAPDELFSADYLDDLIALQDELIIFGYIEEEEREELDSAESVDRLLEKLASTGLKWKWPEITAATTVPTDEEVFNKLFPDDYIDTLSYFQDQLINTGYITEDERELLDSAEGVVNFLKRGYRYIYENEGLSEEDYNRFIESLEGDFSDLIKLEFENYKSGEWPLSKGLAEVFAQIGKENSFSKSFVFNDSSGGCIQKDRGFLGRFKFFLNEFLGREAEAFCCHGPGCCLCLEALCFRQGTAGPLGVNLAAPCCCCCIMVGKVCVPIGCLNLVCPPPAAAIWDPMSGICGCG